MCGIAGYLGVRPLPRIRLEKALLSLEHRGPDGAGNFVLDNPEDNFYLTLGHCRLSIIDLESRSGQPFEYDQSILIFNGELYNYIELKQELKGLGHEFVTKSDTEVLAHALRQWGAEAFTKCEGMWAVAWFDQRAQKILLARDRFGEKPLFIWTTSHGIYFASEVKGLADLVGHWPEVNLHQVNRYLVNGYKSLNKTKACFFKDITQLSAGSLLEIDSRLTMSEKRYWTPELMIDESLTFEDAADKARQSLIKAVELRLRSDVPIAFCMSGGIDSNSLISIAHKVFQHEIHGFTIVGEDPRYDERELVSYAVSEQKLKHTTVAINRDGFIEKLSDAVVQHDAPVTTISYFLHRQLIEAIADAGYRVSISGTGADELFSGYFDHHNLYLSEIAQDKQLFKKSVEAWQKYQKPKVRNPFLQDPEIFIKDPAFRDHIFLERTQFSSWMKEPWEENFEEEDFKAGIMRNRMLNEMFHEAVPVILAEDDLNAMSFSIENRSPFLDRSLFETAYSIPARHLIRDGAAKAVLRSAMRGIVPEKILDNRLKTGFNAPILELIDVRNRDVREYLLDSGPIFNIVERSAIEKALSATTIPNSLSKFLFSFISAKLFLEHQNA